MANISIEEKLIFEKRLHLLQRNNVNFSARRIRTRQRIAELEKITNSTFTQDRQLEKLKLLDKVLYGNYYHLNELLSTITGLIKSANYKKAHPLMIELMHQQNDLLGVILNITRND